jgi:hypothetical protein
MTRAILLGLSMVLGGCFGLDDTLPACYGAKSEAEVDEDLGGFSAELHAAQRTASFPMIDANGVATTLTMETTAVGVVVVERGADCSDNVMYATEAEVSLRSADGRVDLELDGELSYDGVWGYGLVLDVDPVDVDAVAGLPVNYGATDVAVGIGFELNGYDGSGEIVWLLGYGRTMEAATLELPWTAVVPET